MTINTQTLHDNLANKYGAMGSERFDRSFISAVNRSLNDFDIWALVEADAIESYRDDIDLPSRYESVLSACVNYYLQLDGEWSIEDKRDYNAERLNGLRTINAQFFLDGVEDEEVFAGLGDLS